MSRRLLWPALLGVALCALALLPAPPRAAASHGCAAAGSPAGPFPLTSFEAVNHYSVYGKTVELAAVNQLFPEHSSFAVPAIETGPRSAGSGTTTAPYIPPTLLKAISWIESGWNMSTLSVDEGETGPPLLSHSCAYGLMQIVSTMENNGSPPNLTQVSTGSHYGFNVARGANILAGKWNHAPELRPLVGGRNPAFVEDWYYAIWAYHGFAYTNHPMNPQYNPLRGAFRCDGSQPYNSFPYQELVLGCMANPPQPAGAPLWSPLAVTLPNLSQPAFTDPARWTACSQDFDCAGMDVATSTPAHTDPTSVTSARSGAVGAPALAVGPTDLTFLAPPGGPSQTIGLSVANSGTGPLAWRASPGVTWLNLSAQNGLALGSDVGDQPSPVNLTASAAGLEPGTYSGVLNIVSLYPDATKTVNVTLIVAGGAFVPGITRD
jgi:hypothetical protein